MLRSCNLNATCCLVWDVVSRAANSNLVLGSLLWTVLKMLISTVYCTKLSFVS